MKIKTALKKLTKKYSRKIGAIYVNTKNDQMHSLVSIPTGKTRIWKKITDCIQCDVEYHDEHPKESK